MKFQNLKIAITDNDHLKAVCDVLESMGYIKESFFESVDLFIHTSICGEYCGYISDLYWGKEITLADLLKMRDEMVKDNAKSSQE